MRPGRPECRRPPPRSDRSACVVMLLDRHAASMHPVATTGSRAMRPVARAEDISIGALSRLTGVNIETIRYYERIKMMPAPPRTASGRRVYGWHEARILAFIRRSRELG